MSLIRLQLQDPLCDFRDALAVCLSIWKLPYGQHANPEAALHNQRGECYTLLSQIVKLLHESIRLKVKSCVVRGAPGAFSYKLKELYIHPATDTVDWDCQKCTPGLGSCTCQHANCLCTALRPDHLA